MLAVVLALGTFELQLREALVLLFVDNDGVRESLMRGSSRAAEVNMLAGSTWLQLASWRTALYTARVESKANVADGPTRDDLSLVARLSATFVQPVWLSWAWQFLDPSSSRVLYLAVPLRKTRFPRFCLRLRLRSAAAYRAVMAPNLEAPHARSHVRNQQGEGLECVRWERVLAKAFVERSWSLGGGLFIARLWCVRNVSWRQFAGGHALFPDFPPWPPSLAVSRLGAGSWCAVVGGYGVWYSFRSGPPFGG